MSASSQCPHSDINFDINHVHMTDSNIASVQITAQCKICGVAMRLDRGLPWGANSRHPTHASDTEGGILIPMIANGEEPTKEYGFTITRAVIK